MNYREANIRDLEDLVELGYLLAQYEKNLDPLLKVNVVTKAASKKHYEKELTNPSAKFFVAEQDEKIVGYQYGYIAPTPDYLTDHKQIGHLEACYVEEKHRGEGVGKKLTEMLIEWFKESGIKLLELNVYADNSSKEVWEKLGFKAHNIQMRRLL